jgi:hypothetical protein
MECSSFTIGMRQREGDFFFFFFFLLFLSIDCILEWTTDCRLNDDYRAEKRKKRDDGGQHLRAGSKYRTTVYDEVKEKRMKIIINV